MSRSVCQGTTKCKVQGGDTRLLGKESGLKKRVKGREETRAWGRKT